ncbi:uncharacterized protein LOC129312818 [Prosopis cineraria]|uniref:uncharacterized protein LOC129312818 n=1 Tax=Prosopis cineraria TaxID=364024 RepID=UPI00240F8E0F|nr:uncharacterized protein LOC129312818 [Prosopis cineraria]
MVHLYSKANENDSSKPKEKEVLGRREPPKEYQIGNPISRDMPFPKALTRFAKKGQEEDRHDVFDMLKKVEVNIPFLEMIKSMPKCAKFLKELCNNKKGFKPLVAVQMSLNINSVFKPQLPLKYRDPGACTIPCQIGNMFVQEALIDLGAALNVMPTHIYSSLNLSGLQDCSVILQLADQSTRKPKGFLEDILVKVKDLVFPVDFYVLDMQEGGQGTLILGRPFMMTSSTILNMKEGLRTLEKHEQSDFRAVNDPRGMQIDHVALKYLLKKKDTKSCLLRWMLLLQEFNLEIIDRSGAANHVADHLSQLPYDSIMVNSSFDFPCDEFRDKSLCAISSHNVVWWVEAIPTRTNDAKVVAKFLLSHVFYRFGIPRAIITDQGTYFCNKTISSLLQKYGVLHKVATPYHPQTNGLAECSNKEIKYILQKIVRPNRKDWSSRLEEALWVYRTTFKTPIRMSLFRLVYGKQCHLLVEIEHKAYWAVKACVFGEEGVAASRKLQLQELKEFEIGSV